MLKTICIFALIACAGAAAAGTPAKRLFGSASAPSDGAAAAHGSYAKGCIAGAIKLPETGPGWQAMRLSRNRNWGHPDLIAFVARLGKAAQAAGWQRIYVGDLSQPRGGPMISGHRSHQIGLDADIWMREPGASLLSRAARERIGSPSVVAADRRSLNANWTAAHAAVMRAAARDPAVARIFVNAAVKRRLCAEAGRERGWLRKIRPWWGHDAHFHVRLACPLDSPRCEPQAPVPAGDGCDATLDWWFSEEALNPAPRSGPPRRDLILADLPEACAELVGR